MEHSPRFLALVEGIMSNVRECGPMDVQSWLASGMNFHLVDVREESEVAAGRIRGAKHIGRGVLERDIEGLIPDLHARIVLYCGGGYRSALAAESLQRMGYTDVYSMAGGIRAWRSAMLPEEN
jgi:rhodanese-related sulfurtransferase